MDSERAKEIMESKGVIEVLHNGTAVWIENVRNEAAQVTNLRTKDKLEVPLEDLVEKHMMKV